MRQGKKDGNAEQNITDMWNTVHTHNWSWRRVRESGNGIRTTLATNNCIIAYDFLCC